MKHRKVLMTGTLFYQYCQWFDNHGIDYELIARSDYSSSNDAGEQLLKYIEDDGGDGFLVIHHMPSKKMSSVDGIDIATYLHATLKKNIPVIIFTDVLESRLKDLNYLNVENLPPNIILMSERIRDENVFIQVVKSVIDLNDLTLKVFENLLPHLLQKYINKRQIKKQKFMNPLNEGAING